MENKRQSVEIQELVPLIKEVVDGGGKFKLIVNGTSMFPLFIERRDSAILCSADRLKRFDIILYLRSNGSYVLHRILKIKGDELYLCGDNQLAIEYPIYKNQVIAKTCGIIRKGEQLDMHGFKYKFYVFVWCHIIKLRPYLLRIMHKLNAIKAKHKKK